MAGMPQFSGGAGLQGGATIFPSGGAGESLAFRRTRLRGRPNIVGKRDLGEGLLKGQQPWRESFGKLSAQEGNLFVATGL